MIHWLWLIPAAVLGMFVMALCCSSGKRSDAEDWMRRHGKF